MPAPHFALIVIAVLFAAGITVWLLSLGGPGLMVAALPAFMIAAVALRWLRK